MKKSFTFNTKGFISSYTLFLFIIYLSIITFYTTQFSIKLKTIHNINHYYDNAIIEKLKKGDSTER
ncbi:hypothetical protein E2556_08715 [Staphylococcus croceilyticus]|uniref:Sensor histidine kinase n=1 Tax=Staphylococcus croceilyticus TaxID=319942 RepID=A0ABY2KBF9_9STAP|nr:hypothetical protein CD128_00650 [Staphylococcus croceilyticus]TGA76926.1 hypothetical protein E2556_08715 [Staphylococcus croceilyticus]